MDAKPEWWTVGKEQRIGLSVVFRFKRPKKHYHPNGDLREDAPYYVVARKGDIDKLSRALCDALTSVAYDDDDQVVNLTAAKRYCTEEEDPGLTVTLIKLPT
jgi:Holliday junction resolvase RusA-like endonuclease